MALIQNTLITFGKCDLDKTLLFIYSLLYCYPLLYLFILPFAIIFWFLHLEDSIVFCLLSPPNIHRSLTHILFFYSPYIILLALSLGKYQSEPHSTTWPHGDYSALWLFEKPLPQVCQSLFLSGCSAQRLSASSSRRVCSQSLLNCSGLDWTCSKSAASSCLDLASLHHLLENPSFLSWLPHSGGEHHHSRGSCNTFVGSKSETWDK